MSESTNVDIVKRGYDAFQRGDLNALLSLLDAGVEWTTPGPSELPTAGHRRGHQEVAGFFKTLGETFDFERFEPREFIAQGNTVVVIGEDRVRLKNSSTPIDFEWVHVFDLQNGTITRFREFGDTSTLVAELRAAQAIA